MVSLRWWVVVVVAHGRMACSLPTLLDAGGRGQEGGSKRGPCANEVVRLLHGCGRTSHTCRRAHRGCVGGRGGASARGRKIRTSEAQAEASREASLCGSLGLGLELGLGPRLEVGLWFWLWLWFGFGLGLRVGLG